MSKKKLGRVRLHRSVMAIVGPVLHYQIKYCNEVVAQFRHKSDRDLCLDVLREEYPDCDFLCSQEEE